MLGASLSIGKASVFLPDQRAPPLTPGVALRPLRLYA